MRKLVQMGQAAAHRQRREQQTQEEESVDSLHISIVVSALYLLVLGNLPEYTQQVLAQEFADARFTPAPAKHGIREHR